MPNLHPKTHTSNMTITALRLEKYQQKSRKTEKKKDREEDTVFVNDKIVSFNIASEASYVYILSE